MPDVLDAFHPLVAGWFRERFGAPTEPQIAGWPRIGAGEDVLIAAPTGSGKTLAAFLACMDALVRRGLAAPLGDHTSILYISPLKALSNDVHRNLEAPLAELAVYAAARGVALPEIRVGVRTGDTPAGERAKMAKRPPHILVTTPESLYILLTTDKGRAALGQLRTVIVDEIHAVAGDKRGAHLALSLERLDRLVTQTSGRVPVRVGLSATQRPIETIARLLVGTRRPLPHIVDAGHRREIDLAIEITDDELGAVASNEQFARVYDRIAELVTQHRSTILFVNTRRLVERAAAALEQRLGEEHVVAHHGSMSRALRLAAEQKLKLGQVKCAVATASLELGIDVGTVDLVIQLGSPRSIATLLQRVGRSGHTLGGTPKGRMFALTRDQLVECASLVRGVRRGNLDTITLRDAPLDILAQQIVAICSGEEIDEADLGTLVRGAAPYANLPEAQLEQILEMVSEGVSARRGRVGAHVHRDRVAGKLRGRRGARLAAIMCGGAIPDNNNYTVVQWPEETAVGSVDEDFAIESSAGDIFQLGNTAWRIRRIESGKVYVEDAKGMPPTIPFWFGEAPARTKELSNEVSDLRGEICRQLGSGVDLDAIAVWLAAETSMPSRAAQQLVAYLAASRTALGALPRKDLLVAERFFDEGGGMQLVIHAPLGGRINRAWGLALRKKFCVTFDFELQASATDDGIVISLGQPHSFPLDSVFGYVTSHGAQETLVQALLDRPMFEIRWRWNVTRSLTVLRRRGGKKVPPQLVKMRAADTLSVVFPHAVACGENITGPREIPDHPLVFETIRDCLVEAMDVDGLREMCADLESGAIQVLAKDTVEPSPLSHELLNANPYAFLDDAPLEERRARAVTLRRGLPNTVSSSGIDDVGALDESAITAASEEVAPVVRDVDELHDALLGLWLVPEPHGKALAPGADDWFEALTSTGRACRVRWELGEELHAAWVATERLGAVRAILGASEPGPAPAGTTCATPMVAVARVTDAAMIGTAMSTAPADAATPTAMVATPRVTGAAMSSAPADAATSTAMVATPRVTGAAMSSPPADAATSTAMVATPRVTGAAMSSAPADAATSTAIVATPRLTDAARSSAPADTASAAEPVVSRATRVLPSSVDCVPNIATPAWSKPIDRETAILRTVGAHLDHRGPVSARGLAAELGLPSADVLGALLALEGDGAILRGSFSPASAIANAARGANRGATTVRDALAAANDSALLLDLEWCNRRVLARIHRLTLARLRKEIEPVSAAALMRFLLRWQRVARNSQMIGADGLARIVEQLQGFETAAGAWEREVLPARLHGYDQTWLDQLCLGGQVVWCRLSPRANAVVEEPDPEPAIVRAQLAKRVKPKHYDPSDPYNRAEAAADLVSRSGGTREQIAAAAAAAITGTRTPGFGEQIIVQLVTSSTVMRRDGVVEPTSEAPLARGTLPHMVAPDPRRADGRTADPRAAHHPRTADPRGAEPPVRRTAPSRSAPLALMLRRDAGWLRAAAAISQTEQPSLGPLAERVREVLATQGASFLSDLVNGMDLAPSEIEDALWELVGAGIATADGFASLRVLVDRKRGEVKSLFDRAIAANDLPPVRKWQEAIKRARQRDHHRPGHAVRSLPTAAGRWSLLPVTATTAVDAEASARQLLHRYGVVFRDLLARESSLPPWRDLLVALRRLEARGEIRGGRFVTGFVGEQFALPEALDELRAVRNPGSGACVARIAATDPLNLVGILSPGPRVSAVVGNAVLFLDGQAVASVEAGHLVLRAPLPPGARVDDDLTYHPPPRPVQIAPQAALPL